MEERVSHREQKLREVEKIIELIENYDKNTIDERIKGLTNSLHELPDKWVLFKHGKKQEAKKVEIKVNKISAEINENASFKDIVRIVKMLLNYGNLQPILVVRPQALRKLAQFKTGNQTLDSQNKKLLDVYNNLLEQDESNYEKTRQKKKQDTFDKIRKTEFYKGRKKESNKLLQKPDNVEFIPAIGTFADLFRWTSEILNAFGIREDYKYIDKYEIPVDETDYQKKVDSFGKDIEIMNNRFVKLKKYASPEEINEYEKGYKSLLKLHEKFVKTGYYRHLVEITNLVRQIHAIDYTIKELGSIKVRSTDTTGIYKSTVTMLEEAQKKCQEKLEKLGFVNVKDYIKTESKSIDGVDKIVEELQKRDKKAKEEKEEEERKRRLEEKQREEAYDRMRAQSKARQIELEEMEIRKIMEELRPIVLQQIDPHLVDYKQTGVDSWERNDSAYVQEFNSKMRYELWKRGVDTTGVTIISPYESDSNQYSSSR